MEGEEDGGPFGLGLEQATVGGSSEPASAPGSVLGTPADGRGFEFLLEGEEDDGPFGLVLEQATVGGSSASAAAFTFLDFFRDKNDFSTGSSADLRGFDNLDDFDGSAGRSTPSLF